MINNKCVTRGRNYAIDLLRIIAMLMVLTLHINLFGGFFNIKGSPLYELSILLYEHLSIVAVNVFVIISAWFLCDGHTATKKVFQLLITIIFWTIVTEFVAALLGEKITIYDIAKSIPVIGYSYGFLSGYMIMYMVSPYLNIILGSISQRQKFLIAFGIVLLFSFFAPITSSGYLKIGGGYHFAWFIGLYLVTAIIKHSQRQIGKYVYLCLYVILAIIGTLGDYYNINVIGSRDYNNIIVLIESFCIFLFFSKITINNDKIVRWIAFLAPFSFAVFLIHANFVLERYYQQFVFSQYISGTIMYLLLVPVAAVCTYIICSLLEYLRKTIFHYCKLDLTIDGLANKTDDIIDRVVKKLIDNNA